MIARRGGALALICLISGFVAGCGENPSPTPAIVAPAVQTGPSWWADGTSPRYHKDKDRARTIGRRHAAQCNRPLCHRLKARPSGVMMISPTKRRISELFLKEFRCERWDSVSNYLTPRAPPTTASSPMSMRTGPRTVSVIPDDASRYGTSVLRAVRKTLMNDRMLN